MVLGIIKAFGMICGSEMDVGLGEERTWLSKKGKQRRRRSMAPSIEVATTHPLS